MRKLILNSVFSETHLPLFAVRLICSSGQVNSLAYFKENITFLVKLNLLLVVSKLLL